MAIFSADVRGPCFDSYYEKNITDSQEFDIEDYEVFQVFQKQLVKEREI
ncbi:24192_t:CDS:2 [Cetraspora pellucida]|uniref:24192_t:CDS:1 n=1 Tax=Cetraspora pellucida TaxID=1433469 RepID=A0A9N9IKF3_9GLOM|nr:24192_t:CDS:2 [Cetraspora pellucida]